MKKEKDSGYVSRVDSDTKMKQNQIKLEQAASRKHNTAKRAINFFRRLQGEKKKYGLLKKWDIPGTFW